mgnify:CR=1 FL=1
MKKTISVILAVILAATTIPMMMFAAAVPYDVDGSGAVDTIDARLVLQIAAKLRNAVNELESFSELGKIVESIVDTK